MISIHFNTDISHELAMFCLYEIIIEENLSYQYDVLLSLFTSDLDDKISLAQAQYKCTLLSQVIQSQNKIIYTVVNVLNINIH